MASIVTWNPGGTTTWPAENHPVLGSFAVTTLDQVNALSSWGQILGEIYRQDRAYNVYSFSGGPTAVNSRFTAAGITALQTTVNLIRAARGDTAFSFTAATADTSQLLATYATELRQAIDTDTLRLPLRLHNRFYVRRDSPWLTLLDEFVQDGSSFLVQQFGKVGQYSDPISARWRQQCLIYPNYDATTPTYIPNLAWSSAVLNFRYQGSDVTLEALSVRAFLTSRLVLGVVAPGKDFTRPIVAATALSGLTANADNSIALTMTGVDAAKGDTTINAVLFASAADQGGTGADPNPSGSSHNDSVCWFESAVNFPNYIELTL